MLHCGTCTSLLTSHLTPHTSHLTHHTSHLTPHTSHLTPHTSHLTPHTSHLTPHTSHLTPHIQANKFTAMFEVAHGTTLPPLPSSMSQEMHEFVALCLQVWQLPTRDLASPRMHPACIACLKPPSSMLFSRFGTARPHQTSYSRCTHQAPVGTDSVAVEPRSLRFSPVFDQFMQTRV
jgi:hypothetical protein